MPRNSTQQDEQFKEASKGKLIIRIFSYLKPFKLKVALVILLMVVVMVCSLVNPYILKLAIDKYIGTSNIRGLAQIAGFMVVFNIISLIASRIRINIMASVTNSALLNIRQELYTHIQKLSFTFFDNRPVGKILARVIGDVSSLQDLFDNSVTNFIPEILTLIFVTIIMFSMNVKLALISISFLPVLIIALSSIEIFSRKRWQIYRSKRSNLNAFTHEDFSGIRVVQSFATEDKTSKTFVTYVGDMMNAFMKAVRLNDLFWPMVELSWGLGSLLVYWYSVPLIKAKTLTIGELVAFTAYISMFWRPIMNISNFYNTLITNFSSAERIFEILDIKPDIITIDKAIKMPKIKGDVEFKNVVFSYDNDVSVLNNVSFKIKAGETVALVGPTGAGKTTIINLISRFYDAGSGEVLVDGKNVSHVDIESLRSQMGIMLQDTFLFSTTIMENIRYGKLDATDEEVIASAVAVNADSFIMKLDNAYATEVNERGSRLSVGQRQLISFARALLANPRILILDEATSNIDTTTEKLVQKGIKKLLFNRTSFVIAHRLSTIRDCDKIMVIDDGRIVEGGTHAELIDLKGLYYDLYMSQYKFLNEGA
ncbi:ABC transporter ATP-binding protein/permease [Clostridium tagluense]|uniref:ABC transporter ATP-binding protein n=1 Tax=Clostridium tagluense TaxID=360422 RepID=UPI001CF33F88|nr:ABC transporter ATP-binding protein [Clostridium tagluense]MCB2311382.1 ABC transporter ATP-binding protein/permease [Clostridium tagluense]MCB2315976.1 ABC transporter ATP-binding protein/permease [Clostridium tagluense]MCB2320958.1 ABC transporter ATP-binding protein/permease [Clostridium tagluense]MCB2325845.1 ABC transporter ATP-binding protein/permease [Clostridium tagluense]MCB2330698.1 ABC transporter ATP-binding protein/permease [Clostridium tagluense]